MPQMCRLCLRPSSGKHALFKTNIGDSSLEAVLGELFRLELPKGTNLPKYVCDLCLRKTELVHQFHKEVLRAQSLLGEEQVEPKSEGDTDAGHASDGLFDGIEALNEERLLDDGVATEEEEHLEEEELPPVESVQVEAIDFEVEEQLVDIKIEALVEENDEDELQEEHLSEDGLGEQNEAEEMLEEEVVGPVPVKLTRKPRKRKQDMEKLEVVETIPNKCYICNEALDNKDGFEVHLVNHTNMLPHDCLQCSTETNPIQLKTLLALNKHYESHGFNYACAHCPLRFRSYPPLYDHTRNVHTDMNTDFTCETCNQTFVEIRKYRKHMLAHKNHELEKYKCELCNKTFQTGTLLRRHERIHTNEVLFICPFCGRGFNHESNFAQHKLKHIIQQHVEINGHPCKVCSAHFTTVADLRRHMVVHYPDDPVHVAAAEKADFLPVSMRDSSTYPRRCEEANCKYVASTYALMWSHYRNHYKSHPCSECDRKFATVTILKKHVDVVHRKIRKYQCEYCDKTFAYQHKYKEHVHVHMGFKGRECRYCHKTFTHSSNLIVHERIHTQTKPYGCELCGSRYVTSSALKKHQRTHQRRDDDAGGETLKREDPEVEEDEDEPVYLMEEEELSGGGMQDGIVGEMEVEHKELIATLEGD